MSAVLWPNGTTARPHISSPFGSRTSPTAGASSNHKGTDFTGVSAVRAVADGTVSAVGTPVGWSGGGTQVWVQHNGFMTRSLHMVKGSPVVTVGQKVTAGQALGTMGMTGTATGVHLHLEVVVNGVQIDPVPFLTNRIAAPSGGGSTSGDDDMSVQDIYDARDGDGRNMLDLGRQVRSDIAANQKAMLDAISKVAEQVLGRQVIVQGREGLAGKGTSLQAMLAWNDEHVVSTLDAIKAQSTSGVDVGGLAERLRVALAPEIVKALGAALVNG